MPDAPDELAFAGVARSLELLRGGDVSPRDLTELFLRRIERIDPQLNAFKTVLAERALIEADQAGGRLRAGDDRPLLGLPIAVKDDVHVQGTPLTVGSNAHAATPATADSDFVQRLRAAGAIVLGITNVPELTVWPFTETATNGTTRNPWDPQRTPGGSSGGSAAAVAAGLVPVATASDGGGSIRIPAACCGLVGLKPAHDRISYAPKLNAWNGLSTLGFVARSTVDSALMYEAVTGLPWRAAAEREPGRLRIALSFKIPPGVVTSVDPEVRAAVEQLADLLRELGHEVVERDPDYGQLAPLGFSARYLTGVAHDAAEVAEPSRLEPRTKQVAWLGRRLVGERGLQWATGRQAADASRIGAIFDDVDVVLQPGLATLPPRVGKWTSAGGLRTLLGVIRYVPFSPIWNHVGFPALTLPAGTAAGGVPLSAQFAAAPHAEETLLALAGQVERARPWAGRTPELAS